MFEKFSKASFLIGPAPIRRTLPYLESGKLIFKPRVKVMEVHYNMFWKSDFDEERPRTKDVHTGLQEFYFWCIPQIQYKNPGVQIVRFLEMTPLPFIRCWLDDGKDVLFDCDSKSKQEILDQVIKTLGKSNERLADEKRRSASQETTHNPAIFGFGRDRFCMCEIPGQVPCPGTVPLPKGMQAKYTMFKPEELEEWESNLDAPYMTEKEKMEWNKWYPVRPEPILPQIEDLDKLEIGKPGSMSTDDTVRRELAERKAKAAEAAQKKPFST